MLKLFIPGNKNITLNNIREALLFHSLVPTHLLSGATKNYKIIEEYGRNNNIVIEKYSPPKGIPWVEACKERLHTILEKCDEILIIEKHSSPSSAYVYSLVSSPSFTKPFYVYK